MKSLAARKDIVEQLQKEILSLQKLKKPSSCQNINTGLDTIEQAFPNHTFPIGAVHEFISYTLEDAAATSGFIEGLLGSIMNRNGICLWISTRRTLFPPALKLFGISPERIVFIDLTRSKDALWTIEEALKCGALSAVVGEIRELSFTESRRLQLAVEQSGVTGFVHRYQPKIENIVACVTRWKVKQLPGIIEQDMPGIGLPHWYVQLQKVRNGRPDTWQVEWAADNMQFITRRTLSIPAIQKRKTG